MFDAIIGAGISAGAKLIGGKMDADASNKAARLNAIAQANENAFAREYNERMTREAQAREERLQREFATQGIQWRAADARAAGLHPLAAMGAQTHSFSSSVGAPQYQPGSVAPYAGKSMGSAVADMGQDVSRAIQATRKEDQRTEVFTQAQQALTLENMSLQNQLLSSQIGKFNSAQVGPAMPSAQSKRMINGQGNTPSRDLGSGDVKPKPLEITVHSRGNATQEPAPITDVGYARTQKGFAVIPSKDVKERIEDNWLQEINHFVRNNVLPAASKTYFNPPAESPGEGREWYFSPLTGEYRTRKNRAQRTRSYPGFRLGQ